MLKGIRLKAKRIKVTGNVSRKRILFDTLILEKSNKETITGTSIPTYPYSKCTFSKTKYKRTREAINAIADRAESNIFLHSNICFFTN